MNKKLIIISITAMVLISVLMFMLGYFTSDRVNLNTNATEPSTENATIQPSATPDTIPITTAAPTQPIPTAPTGNSTSTNRLSLAPLCQYPELPTGCEVTSLTMVLNFYGLGADKCDIADNYLVKGAVGTVDFREAFEGDPRDENSYGCYAPVIAEAANKYISAKGASLNVTEITGTTLEGLFPYIDRGIPVIVWGTRNCEQGHYSVTWNVNGEDLTWFTPEHCMVLVGYTDTEVLVADPLHGDIRSYDKNLFALCYDSLYRQAIVIE